MSSWFFKTKISMKFFNAINSMDFVKSSLFFEQPVLSSNKTLWDYF